MKIIHQFKSSLDTLSNHSDVINQNVIPTLQIWKLESESTAVWLLELKLLHCACSAQIIITLSSHNTLTQKRASASLYMFQTKREEKVLMLKETRTNIEHLPLVVLKWQQFLEESKSTKMYLREEDRKLFPLTTVGGVVQLFRWEFSFFTTRRVKRTQFPHHGEILSFHIPSSI